MTKLAWQKALRGAELSPTEYMVLLTISTYTDEHLEHAHPGWARLADDTHLDRRTIKKAVDSLRMKGYLVLTMPGGNQYRKGLANEYHLTLPSRGTADAPLDSVSSHGALTDHDDQGVHLVQQGGHSMQGRGTPDAWEGVHPVTPHQVLSSGPSIRSIHHHSEADASASAHADAHAKSTDTTDTTPTDWQALIDGEELLQEWLEARFDGITAMETQTAYYMWENDQHPIAIFNTIAKQRREEWGT